MYKSPKECYIKAPVRRETERERLFRHHDQVPARAWLWEKFKGNRFVPYTVNKGLKPGRAQYIKDVSGV